MPTPGCGSVFSSTSSSKADPAWAPREPLLIVTLVCSPNSSWVLSETYKPVLCRVLSGHVSMGHHHDPRM